MGHVRKDEPILLEHFRLVWLTFLREISSTSAHIYKTDVEMLITRVNLN